MKILLAYVAVANGVRTDDFAARFVATYHEYPPDYPHETAVICKGGPLKTRTGLIFSSMPCSFFPHKNEGWDISSYLEISKHTDSDMILCFGESIYFHRRGWLKRIVDAWTKHGPGMYGLFSSNLVRPHLNTTGFVCARQPLSEYPNGIKTKEDRYAFEHGENPFWKWMSKRNYPTMLVTWDGEWEPRFWRYPKNILWRGDQSNCLARCTHTDRFDQVGPDIKAKWIKGADKPFK